MRKFFPVTSEDHGGHWFVSIDGKRHVTPIFLCLAAIVAADIAFAVDSIPAAFAITRDSVLIWMGNVFALLGLRALFVLVEGLIRRFRYLDETIAVVLALVGGQAADRGPRTRSARSPRWAIVAAAFAVGITASLIADRRDPDAAAKREERGQRTSRSDDDDADGSGDEAEAESPDGARAERRRSWRARRRSIATASRGAHERVGGDAAVGHRQGGDGAAVGDGQEDRLSERLGLVEGGEAGDVPSSTGPAGRR